MNSNDKQAYYDWINPRDYYFDMDGEAWLNREVVSIFSETEDAWLAACKYKDDKMNEETRMALPIELDMIKLASRVNELEYQIEVMKDAIRWLIFTGDVYDYDKLAELKVLINPNLFVDDEIEEDDGGDLKDEIKKLHEANDRLRVELPKANGIYYE